MRAAMRGGIKQLCEQPWKVIWSSYASSRYEAAMRAVMKSDMEQLCEVLWSSYANSYEKWYGAAVQAVTQAAMETPVLPVWEEPFSSFWWGCFLIVFAWTLHSEKRQPFCKRRYLHEKQTHREKCRIHLCQSIEFLRGNHVRRLLFVASWIIDSDGPKDGWTLKRIHSLWRAIFDIPCKKGVNSHDTFLIPFSDLSECAWVWMQGLVGTDSSCPDFSHILEAFLQISFFCVILDVSSGHLFVPFILPRSFAPSTAFLFHTSGYKQVYYPNLTNMARRQTKRPTPEDQGTALSFILRMSELIICRKAVSEHQTTASPAKKPTFTSNTTVSQAVLVRGPYPERADISFPFSKHQPQEQKSMYHLGFSDHVVVLTWGRHHSPRKSLTTHRRLLENAYEDKNKQLDILRLGVKSSVLRSDRIPRLRPASTREHHINRRRMTPATAALTHWSTGARLESGQKSTSNKIARSEQISREANHREHQND